VSDFPRGLAEVVDLGDKLGKLNHDNIDRPLGVTYGFGRMPGFVMNLYTCTVTSYIKQNTVDDETRLGFVRCLTFVLSPFRAGFNAFS
jgi:hypothetical protein